MDDSALAKRLRMWTQSRLVIFLGAWFFLTAILAIKIPSAHQKIYAEDGASLQQSIENPFPNELFEPVAGYLDLLLRGAGALVSLFPLEFAPVIFFIVNTFLLAILWIAVFTSSRSFVSNYRWRFVLGTSLIFLPIGNFESIVNSANLHFYFMAACVVILLSRPRSTNETLLFCFVIFLSASSIPLMILTFPVIMIRFLLVGKLARSWRDSAIVVSWILGNILQLTYLFAFTIGERKVLGFNSLIEVIYLYLDRVVGSSVIPFWGSVSSSTESPLPGVLEKSSYLLLRAAVAFGVLLAITLLSASICCFSFQQKLTVLVFLATSVIHWLLVGTLFNPEPRYAVFSSYCLIVAVVYSLQNLRFQSPKLEFAVIALVVLTWLGSWTPSSFRTEGPDWKVEFHKAKTNCANGNLYVDVLTSPINRTWKVKLSCNYVLKDR